MTATIGIANKLDKNIKDPQITIDTKNLNGEFVAANGTIKIYKLTAPQQVLRPRPWSAPDLATLDEAAFKNYSHTTLIITNTIQKLEAR